MNKLNLDSVIDPQVKIVSESLTREKMIEQGVDEKELDKFLDVLHGRQSMTQKKCHRCLRDIETTTVTDYNSEGDGQTVEAEKGHDENTCNS